MHTAFGKTMKYVLRVILIFILSLLLVGLIKYRGDVNAYVTFLNTRDRGQARGELSISHPATFANMFRGTGEEQLTGIDVLSGELLTGDTWLNAYDPSMEADLNDVTSGDSTDQSGYGFKNVQPTVTPDTTTASSGEAADSAKAQLLNLIKQHEMNK